MPREPVSVDSKKFGPFGYTSGVAVVKENPIGACVSRLLLTCCPSHVAWFIMSVIVDTVDAVGWRWPASNIGQERAKPISAAPAIVNANAPSAVAMKMLVFGITASLNHRKPCGILWIPATAPVSRAVSVLALEALRTPRILRFYLACFASVLIATSASNNPLSVNSRHSSGTNDSEWSDYGACQIASPWRLSYSVYSSVCHLSTSFDRLRGGSDARRYSAGHCALS